MNTERRWRQGRIPHVVAALGVVGVLLTAACAAANVDTAGTSNTASGGSRPKGSIKNGEPGGFDVGDLVGQLAPVETSTTLAPDTTAAPIVTQAPVTQAPVTAAPRVTQAPVTLAPAPPTGGGGGGRPAPQVISTGDLSAAELEAYNILGGGRQLEANLQNYARAHAAECGSAQPAIGSAPAFTSFSVAFGGANSIPGAANAAKLNISGNYGYIGVGVAAGGPGVCVIAELAG